jgi:hypothetical protein
MYRLGSCVAAPAPAVTRICAVAFILAASVLTDVASATRFPFAGFPADGVKASTPTSGKMLLSLRPTANTTWTVYADGRIIWQKWTELGDATVVPRGARRLDTGWVQQRLTLQGAQMVRSKVLSTGLFEHNLILELGRGHPWALHQVRRGDRIVTVDGVSSPDPSWNEHFTKATPSQMLALASIEKLVAHPATYLPPTAWADQQIRPFVPARYTIALDRGYPDLAMLPARARAALSQYKDLRRHGCQVVTTSRARALLHAFAEAGISPSDNHAFNIAFDAAALRSPHPTYLHLHPALPDDHC